MIEAKQDAQNQALGYLRKKYNKPSWDWDDVWKKEHSRAFTVAKANNQELLMDIREGIDDALGNGTTLANFKADLMPKLSKRGWTGFKTLPDGSTVELGTPRRLKLIFDTNLRTSRAAGQWERFERSKKTLPYLIYSLGASKEHRVDHLEWDGLVLGVDDPFWNTHAPPNGFGCKCRLRATTKKSAERRGISSSPKIKRRRMMNRKTGKNELVPFGVDRGWDYNPAGRIGKTKTFGKEKAVEFAKVVGTVAKPVKAIKPKAPAYVLTNKMTPDEAKAFGQKHYDEIFNQKLVDVGGKLEGMTIGEGLASVSVNDYSKVFIAQQYHAAIIKRLGDLREISTPAKSLGSAKARSAINRASKRYPDSWTKFSDSAGDLNVRYTESGRGWANTAKKDDYLNMGIFGRRRNVKKGEGFILTGNGAVAEHEFAHRIQKTVAGLDDVFVAEHLRRTKGQPLERMRDITGNKRYGVDEVSRKDGYYNPYQGREYKRAGGYEPAEVMTMSFEPLVGEPDLANAEKLRQFFKGDSDMVKLALGLLFHWEP
jgi:hypothetical protein